jgi:UDPglucose 6-dehydrogenase
MAFHNPHVNVTVVDRDERRIRRWNSRHLPIYEPGLVEIVRLARDGGPADASRTPNLSFSTDSAKHIGEADIVLIAVNTPTKQRGAGAGVATDMTAVEAVAAVVAQYARPGAIIVEKSTVPCKTAELIQETVRNH